MTERQIELAMHKGGDDFLINYKERAVDEKLLTVREVAERLRVGPAWVYARAKKLPCLRVGRFRRYRLSDVVKFLEKQRENDGQS